MGEWPLQDAKNKFSAVVNAAMAGEPQRVTRRGQPAVVVLSVDEYERLRLLEREEAPSFGRFAARNAAGRRRVRAMALRAPASRVLMYLLDTDVLSAVRRRDRNPETVRWIEAQRTSDLYMSVVTVGEIERGIDSTGAAQSTVRPGTCGLAGPPARVVR